MILRPYVGPKWLLVSRTAPLPAVLHNDIPVSVLMNTGACVVINLKTLQALRRHSNSVICPEASSVRCSGLNNKKSPVLGKIWLTLQFCDSLPEACAPYHVTENLSLPAHIVLGIYGMIYGVIKVCPPKMGIKQWVKFIPAMDYPKPLL